jgi:hypothetical protein
MWTANIDNKIFKSGKLTVIVTYTNGNENITENHEVTQKQDTNWLNDIINRKLNDLNSLSDINDSIVIGIFNEEVKAKSDKDLYYENASKYMKYMDIARMGIIQHDKPIIIELKEWLILNFKDEYTNLF